MAPLNTTLNFRCSDDPKGAPSLECRLRPQTSGEGYRYCCHNNLQLSNGSHSDNLKCTDLDGPGFWHETSISVDGNPPIFGEDSCYMLVSAVEGGAQGYTPPSTSTTTTTPSSSWWSARARPAAEVHHHMLRRGSHVVGAYARGDTHTVVVVVGPFKPVLYPDMEGLIGHPFLCPPSDYLFRRSKRELRGTRSLW